MSGKTSYLAGKAAEDSVNSAYLADGWTPRARRWRGCGGEIDLVFERFGALAFVEVKKSRDFASAAARITERQIARIRNAAAGFLASMPQGQNTEARFDAALVDATGAVQVIENAF